MKSRGYLTPVTAILCIGCLQSPVPDSGLLGVWTIAQIEYADGAVNTDPEPSQAIFTDSNYSLVWIPLASSMRLFQERWVPTDAEKVRRYGEIVVNSGTYELEGDSLMTLFPVVSRVPGFMGGGRFLYEFRVRGDTLWLTSLDEYSYDGIQAPWAASDDGVKLSLSKVEDIGTAG